MPPDSKYLSNSGWINAGLFLKWLKLFVEHNHPLPERKALLIPDNHESHRSINVIEYAKANHVIILSVPPHTSHCVQLLDVSVCSSFKGRFEKLATKWQKHFLRHILSLYDMNHLFGESYLFASTPNNTIHGFLATGIAECKIDIFTACHFAPVDVTVNNDAPLPTPLPPMPPRIPVSPRTSALASHLIDIIAEEEEIAAIENEVPEEPLLDQSQKM